MTRRYTATFRYATTFRSAAKISSRNYVHFVTYSFRQAATIRHCGFNILMSPGFLTVARGWPAGLPQTLLQAADLQPTGSRHFSHVTELQPTGSRHFNHVTELQPTGGRHFSHVTEL